MDVLTTLIYPVIDEMRPSVGPGFRSDPSTPLVGAGAVLDSLQLVMFVVAVEDRIQSQTGKHVTLTGDQSLQAAQSPFTNVGTLASFVTELLRESPAG
jgi:hypothetical protein